MEHPEQTRLTDATPEFGWIYNPSFRSDRQSAFRIIVASSQAVVDQGIGDVWDSGTVTNGDSINVPYAGPALQTSTDYFWRVQTWDANGQQSAFSPSQQFRTEGQFTSPPANGLIYSSSTNAWANRYPLRFVSAAPVLVTNTANKRWFMDFGQDAFAYVTLHLNGSFAGQTMQARFGEMATNLAVRTSPPVGSSVRYASTNIALQNGDIIYQIRPPNISGSVIDIRSVAGVVLPFRYFEVTNCPGTITAADVTQKRLQYEFNDSAATFDSSSPELNQVWELCKYSMKATSFAGAYVDGDRERKPYEADAYINQLSHYGVDREFTLARYSHEYLLAHPTWPFEWKFHSILMAWVDYQWTGNSEALYAHYDTLKTKLFLYRARADGLIQGFPVGSSIDPSDIIDWPTGERDGYVRTDYCTVINAFYYQCLRIMAQVADLTGHTSDASDFTARADQVYTNFDTVFWNTANQRYQDGETTTHSADHANFFPLAFGLVPEAKRASVLNFIHSRAMAPSVYGAQYLLEALYENGDADFAFGLMTTNGLRGWLNMLNIGSTITTEAWNFSAKPNMDWNHAWGAAPGNIIPRYVLGLRPLEAGFGRVLIQPQLGEKLSYAEGTVPSIRGTFFIHADNATNVFHLRANIPGNVTACVMLPAKGAANPVALVDGDTVSGSVSNGWLTLTNIGSGEHAIWLSLTNQPAPATLYSNWAAAWFGTNAGNDSIAGPAADPEGDGGANLLEFATGSDPLAADAENFNMLCAPAPAGQFALHFRHRASLPVAFSQFQQSTNLTAWSPVTPLSVSTVQDFGEVLLLEATFPVQGEQSYYRICYSQ